MKINVAWKTKIWVIDISVSPNCNLFFPLSETSEVCSPFFSLRCFLETSFRNSAVAIMGVYFVCFPSLIIKVMHCLLTNNWKPLFHSFLFSSCLNGKVNTISLNTYGLKWRSVCIFFHNPIVKYQELLNLILSDMVLFCFLVFLGLNLCFSYQRNPTDIPTVEQWHQYLVNWNRIFDNLPFLFFIFVFSRGKARESSFAKMTMDLFTRTLLGMNPNHATY